MNQVIMFEGKAIDTLNEDGSPWDGISEAWFIPRQVAEAIGAKNAKNYATKIINKNPDRFSGFIRGCQIVTPGGAQKVNIINENGLYIFLMASDLPQAVQFQRQVSEVIKQTRKSNTSTQKLIPRNYKEAVIALLGQIEENEKLQETIQEQKPKVDLHDRMISANNNQTFNEVAKAMKTGRNKLIATLREKNILMCNNLPYQRYLNSGYFHVREVTKNGMNFTQTLVTPKGIEYIGKMVLKNEKHIISHSS